MNIVAASFSELHSNPAFLVDEFLSVAGAGGDHGHILSHRVAASAEAQLVAAGTHQARDPNGWSVETEHLVSANLSVRMMADVAHAVDVSISDDAIEASADDGDACTLWTLADATDAPGAIGWSISGHSLQ